MSIIEKLKSLIDRQHAANPGNEIHKLQQELVDEYHHILTAIESRIASLEAKIGIQNTGAVTPTTAIPAGTVEVSRPDPSPVVAAEVATIEEVPDTAPEIVTAPENPEDIKS